MFPHGVETPQARLGDAQVPLTIELVASFANATKLLEDMKQFDFSVRIPLPHMRPLPDEHTALKPATTPIPVQLSEPEFTACILPHLTMHRRGPKCTLGYHHVFHLILWVLYTGM